MGANDGLRSSFHRRHLSKVNDAIESATGSVLDHEVVSRGVDVASPVEPRAAATLMLLREACSHGQQNPELQVLMLRRSRNLVFAGGAHVFPGGAVDPADREQAVESFCNSRTDAEASELLGISSGGLGFFVAAIRECFEEAGLLLGITTPGPLTEDQSESGLTGTRDELVDLTDPEDERRFSQHRRALIAGEVDLIGICRSEGLTLRVDRLHYFSHWVTPKGSHRRFDTRFFVAAAPLSQAVSCDGVEMVSAGWLAPSEALRSHEAGAMSLMPPTIENLRALSRFSKVSDVIEHAAGLKEIPLANPASEWESVVSERSKVL